MVRCSYCANEVPEAQYAEHLGTHTGQYLPKPSEVFPPSEKHKCFCGEHYFSPHSAHVCPKCGWLICSVCGKCACHLSPEAREAIEAVWETYCVFCRFRPHSAYKPEV